MFCVGPAIAVTLPYFEDFENESTCNSSCNTHCTLSSGWLNKYHIDDHDWLVNNGNTSSFGTGPESDHTLGTENGKYLYKETSSPCGTSPAVNFLVSPIVDLTGTSTPQFEFYYHMYGENMGTLHIDILDSNQKILVTDIIPPLSDNINLWQSKTVDLSAFTSQLIHIRFRGVHSGTGFGGDMALDDVYIAEGIDVIFVDDFE